MNLKSIWLSTGCSLLLGMLLPFGLSAQSSNQEAAVASVQESATARAPKALPIEGNSLLWEISGHGLKKSSYLYGTIHIIPKDSFFITPEVEQTMQKSSRLVLEVALDGSAIMASAMGMMMIKPTLSDLLTEDDYDYLRTFMKDSLSTPLPMFQMIKPIFIAQHIASSYCMTEDVSSYEMYFMEEFQKMDKPLSGLETASEQMKYLDAITLEEQAENLMQTVRNPRESCEQYHDMVRLYRSQDLTSLAKLTQEDAELGDHLDKLLDERNQNWISKIEEMTAKESVFIAVGAGHLPGENGVIALLRAQGYTVSPLPKISE